MSLPCEIVGTNGTSSKYAVQMHRRGQREIGLVAYTEDLVETSPYFVPHTNSEFGQDMNVAAAWTGTPQLIHDGGDTGAWTGTTVVGGSIDFAASGGLTGNAVRFNSPVVGSTAQFDKGSDVTADAYLGLSMQVYVNRRWDANGDTVLVYGWDTGTSQQVGEAIDLKDYINESTFDVWQLASIPLSAMGLSGETFDSIRVEVAGIVGFSPDFYLDDIQLEETGGSVEFRAYSARGRRFYVREIVLSAAYTGTGAFNWEDFMGLTLPTGITFRVVQKGAAGFSAPLKTSGDLLSVGVRHEATVVGTNTFIQFVTTFDKPRILYGDPRSYFSVTINDDLSSLLRFRSFLRGSLEVPVSLSETE